MSQSNTHTLKLPPKVYDSVDVPLSMLKCEMFADLVSEGDFVKIEDPDGRSFLARVTGTPPWSRR